MKSRALTSALLVLALTPALRADIIELGDGRKFSGTMSRTGDVMTIKTDDGKVITAKPSDIAKVTLTSNLTPEEAAAQDWARMSAQVKTTDNLQAVLDLYQGFVDKHPDARQAGEARATLAIYKSLLNNDPVKFRGRWMPRAQVAVVLKKWTETARPALDLYQAGRMKETLDAVKTILTDDDQNPDALMLGGLAAYRSNNLSQARTYFTNLSAADPSSLLAENNLAVIAAGQKQAGESFTHYVKALQIMPDHRLLLDNVAEALNSFTAGGGDKNTTAYRTLAKAYEPAETRMEEVMAKQGQVRWGSTWVTREQRDRLVKAQETMRDQIGRLDSQYTAARNALAALDALIKQSNVTLANEAAIINTCAARILASQGIAVDVSFYQAQLDVAMQNQQRMLAYRTQLQVQFDQLMDGTKDFLAQAEKLKTAYNAGSSTGQYTGVQRIVDLGQTDTPPAPTSVAEPAPITLPPTPPILIAPPPAPVAPTLVPIPVGGPVGIPLYPVPNRGANSGPATGPATGPASPPRTQPATRGSA
jgi:tetratricopeptide (TPR) repeat protein